MEKLQGQIFQGKRADCIVWPTRLPGRIWLRDKPRSREKVSPAIAAAVRPVTLGEEPVPLTLVGNVGGGKTCLGLVLCDVFGGVYHDFAQFCEDIRYADRGDLQDEAGFQVHMYTLWKDFREANLTVLDDIGMRSDAKDAPFQILKRCLDSRENKPAVFITNAEWPELEEIYDQRIVSRLQAGTVVRFATDRRVQAVVGC